MTPREYRTNAAVHAERTGEWRYSIDHTNATEGSTPHLFVAEASELGFLPGIWPERLRTKLGNGMPFIRRSKKVDADGDIEWVTYDQANGCVRLRVFND